MADAGERLLLADCGPQTAVGFDSTLTVNAADASAESRRSSFTQ